MGIESYRFNSQEAIWKSNRITSIVQQKLSVFPMTLKVNQSQGWMILQAFQRFVSLPSQIIIRIHSFCSLTQKEQFDCIGEFT
jgi:hypothetical protein